MRPSMDFPPLPGVERYPEFCEVRVLQTVNAAAYDQCANISQGYVVKLYDEELVIEGVSELIPGCRLIVSPVCAAGLNRIDAMVCRATIRRTWSCGPNIPTNDYNTCYVPNAMIPTPHPACLEGAPQFVVTACSDYVGTDYLQVPTSVSCSSFDTGDPATALTPNSIPGASNSYWCDFDQSLLRLECHASPQPPDCVPVTATCIKRVSQTGGCDAIANAIRCRALQFEFNSGRLDIEDVRNGGCTPCTILPFEDPPEECPADITGRPSVTSAFASQHDALHRVREDFKTDAPVCVSVRRGGDMTDACRQKKVCSDPPQGRLSWTSNHYSGSAVVNSPVTVFLHDIASESTAVEGLVSLRSGRYIRPANIGNLLQYPDADADDAHMLLFPQLVPSLSYDDVWDLISFAVEFPVTGSACALEEQPRIVLEIEELLPDRDADEIERLFGQESLDWWRSLSTGEQRDRIQGRGLGLTYWSDLVTSSEQTAENALRAGVMTASVPCNTDGTVWCRWTPTRSGYFSLTGAASWIGTQYITGRVWEWEIRINNMNTYIRNNSPAIAEALADMGMTPAQVGINDSVTALLPTPPGLTNSWLYSEDAGESFRCPSIDLRVACGGTGRGGNFTETAPIGVLVHEIRVVTRVPVE